MPAFPVSPRGLNVVADHPRFRASALPRMLTVAPFCFVDVGARGGVHELASPVARHTASIAFEPDEDECNRLRARYAGKTDWAALEFEPVALYCRSGTLPLYLQKVATNHSLLPPNRPFIERYRMEKFSQIGETRVTVRTLDEVLAQRRSRGEISSPDLIKLDTQGSEFEVLVGGAQALRSDVVAIVTEVSFCEVYAGQKLFSDLDFLLRDAGFSFFGFDSLHQRSRRFLDKHTQISRERAIFGDAVFLKDPLPGGRAGGSLSPRKLIGLFLSAVLTGYHDFALELVAGTELRGLQGGEELEIMVRDLASAPPAVAVRAVRDLANAVEQAGDRGNLEVGRFVDERRHYCDYHDVFNVSSLPSDYS